MKSKILVVDDEEHIRELIRFYLDKEGFSVAEAETGQKALEILENEYIDLAIVDIMMPVMDGLEATREIRTMNRSDASAVAIIAMTANAFAEDKKRAFDAGMNGHIAKPIDIEKLGAVILSVLKKQESLQIGKNNSING